MRIRSSRARPTASTSASTSKTAVSRPARCSAWSASSNATSLSPPSSKSTRRQVSPSHSTLDGLRSAMLRVSTRGSGRAASWSHVAACRSALFTRGGSSHAATFAGPLSHSRRAPGSSLGPRARSPIPRSRTAATGTAQTLRSARPSLAVCAELSGARPSGSPGSRSITMTGAPSSTSRRSGRGAMPGACSARTRQTGPLAVGLAAIPSDEALADLGIRECQLVRVGLHLCPYGVTTLARGSGSSGQVVSTRTMASCSASVTHSS